MTLIVEEIGAYQGWPSIVKVQNSNETLKNNKFYRVVVAVVRLYSFNWVKYSNKHFLQDGALRVNPFTAKHDYSPC